MFTYTYYASDFLSTPEAFLLGILMKRINALNLASGTISYINSDDSGVNKIYSIHFSNELSPGDKILLDNQIAVYVDPSSSSTCTIRDIKMPGTNGGTFTENIWVTRNLNNVDLDVVFLSLTNNVVTIEPGTYIIDIRAPACNVRSNQIRLRNITAGEFDLGSSAYSDRGVVTSCTLHATFTFDVETEFDIQHICSRTVNNIGFGRASGNDTSEIYTTMFIRQV